MLSEARSSKQIRRAAVLSAAVLAFGSAVQATPRTLYWDPAGTCQTTGASGGSGTWGVDSGSSSGWSLVAPPGISTSAGDTWWSSGTDQNGTDYSTAVFGVTPGTVTIVGQSSYETRFGSIQFTCSGYNLVPGATNPYLGVRIANATIDTGTYSNEIDAPFYCIGTGGGPIEVTGSGTLTLGGSKDGVYGALKIDNGVTVILNKASVPGSVRAIGMNTTTLPTTVLPGATLRLAGTGGDQIRDKTTLNVNGTLDMNGHSEAIGPSNLMGGVLDFTLGSTLGANDLLTITNASADPATTSTPGGYVYTSGTNTINIAARTGVTSLTPGNYTLMTAANNLGTSAFALGSSSIVVGGTTYSLSLANSTGTAEILTVAAAEANQWGAFTSGNWSDTAKWTGGSVPADALLASKPAADATITIDAPVTASSLTVDTTHTYTLNGSPTNTITVNGPVTLKQSAALALSGQTTLRSNGLSMSDTSRLDINDSKAIIHGATVATVEAQLAAGRNVAAGGIGDGTWDGSHGIVSTAAATAFKNEGIESKAVGLGISGSMPMGDPTVPGTSNPVFAGAQSGDVLLRYTYNGDATMDGVVDDFDVIVVGALYDAGATSGHHWYEGDFNGDGKIDDSDVILLGAFYAPIAPVLSDASLTQQYGAEFAKAFEAGRALAVPEPATLSVLGIGAMGLLGRRRRGN